MEGNEKFLHDYLNSCSPPMEKEDSCLDVWIKYVGAFSDRIVRDSYGSVAAIQSHASPCVAPEAHCNEIAWQGNYISPQGYIYVVRSGGSDPVIAPSKKVRCCGQSPPACTPFIQFREQSTSKSS